MSCAQQVQSALPWFLESMPSEECAKGGAGAYNDALQRDSGDASGIAGLEAGVVEASCFRSMYVPLGKQQDFIDAMQVGTGGTCRGQEAREICRSGLQLIRCRHGIWDVGRV
jgi:hypothetical protein